MHGQVTALKRQQRRRDRVSVFLDGAFAFGLQEILAARLRIGQELSQAQVADLLRLEAAEQAYERTLHFLSFRPRSAQEVRRYLGNKGVDEQSCDVVVERLQQARLLDDREFAEFWVSNRRSFRPRGRWALRSELQAKGVSREVIEAVLEGLNEEADAMRAAEHRAQKLVDVDDATFRRRLVGFLQRRGFGYDVTRRVVEHYLQVKAQEE